MPFFNYKCECGNESFDAYISSLLMSKMKNYWNYYFKSYFGTGVLASPVFLDI